MRLINPNISYRIYNFLFLALAVVLPIHGKLVPPVIVMIGLNWILELNFREKYRMVMDSPRSKYLLAFGVLYLLYVVGTFYSSQMRTQEGALFNLEVKLSLLVFPLLFSTIDLGLLKENFRNKLLYAYVVGCFISILLIFNNAVFSYFQTDNIDVFYYVKLGFVHHPSYLSLNLTFAVAVLLAWIFEYKKQNKSKRNAGFILIFVFQLFIVLLSSKAGILATAGIYLAIIGYLIIHREKRTHIYTSGFLLLLFVITLSFFPNSYSRFYSAESAIENEPNTDSRDGSIARVLVWQSSLDIIKENPLFGVGTGDVEPELMKRYQEKNITLAMDETLNAHNQYLQTFIALGIMGFLVLAASLLLPAWYAFRKKHLLYLIFLAIFAFNILVESMLERQAGVVFYAFFNSFLFYFAFKGKVSSNLQES